MAEDRDDTPAERPRRAASVMSDDTRANQPRPGRLTEPEDTITGLAATFDDVSLTPTSGIVTVAVAPEDEPTAPVPKMPLPPSVLGASAAEIVRFRSEFDDWAKYQSGRRHLIEIRLDAVSKRVGEAVEKSQNAELRAVELWKAREEFRPQEQFQARVTAELAAIHGVDGRNGKLSTLRAYVDDELATRDEQVWGKEGRKDDDPPVVIDARANRRAASKLVAAAIAAIATALAVTHYYSEKHGDDVATMRTLESQVQTMWSQLITHPGKTP